MSVASRRTAATAKTAPAAIARSEHVGSPHGARRLRGRASLHRECGEPHEPEEHRRDLAGDLHPYRSGARARLGSQLRFSFEHGDSGHLRPARVEHESTGVEGVEVECLAAGEGGFVSERDELASLDERAADVDGSTDDDEEGQAEEQAGDENCAALFPNATGHGADPTPTRLR